MLTFWRHIESSLHITRSNVHLSQSLKVSNLNCDLNSSHNLASWTKELSSFSPSLWLYCTMPFCIITRNAANGDFWMNRSDRRCSWSDGLLCRVRSKCHRLRTRGQLSLREVLSSSMLTWWSMKTKWIFVRFDRVLKSPNRVLCQERGSTRNSGGMASVYDCKNKRVQATVQINKGSKTKNYKAIQIVPGLGWNVSCSDKNDNKSSELWL